ncbi:porin [Rhizobium sp. Rhizsp82]|uniref:porin n=1 Tax=Rhizobium sp. Rhizsp82 TaxID=3243057 RepID=UPI0039B518CC
MNIRSILIGSAAALSSVSGAYAADAIVAAEPEAVEYVRVCDAYGTGYFYIPGTETCLKIGGYLRFDVGFGAGDAYKDNANEDWQARTRAHVAFDAKSDTEYGTLTSRIVLESNFRGGSADTTIGGLTGGDSTMLGDAVNETVIDQAYIDIAGLRVGKFTSWWDDDFSGETDAMANVTNTNAIRYQYDAGDFYAGAALEELNGNSGTGSPRSSLFTGNTDIHGNTLGVDASVGGKFSNFTWAVYGGYDAGNQEGAVTARIGADVGPGKAEIAAIWSSGLGDAGNGGNAYYANGEWTVVAQYALKATDKFTITPAAQYTNNIVTDADGSWDDGNMWRAGVTLDYQVVENLNAKLAATYVKEDYGNQTVDGRKDADWVEGFFRLQRDF